VAKTEVKWIAVAAIVATGIACFAVVVIRQISASLAQAKADVAEERAKVGDAFKRAKDEVGGALKRAEDEASDAVKRAADEADDAFKRAESEAAHGLGELKSDISGIARHGRSLPLPKSGHNA
jgi:hypothetical protein